MSVLSDRLRELRGTTSQAEMARQLNMKQPQWARYESGASSPSVELLATICRVHACSADWLLGLRERGEAAGQLTTPNSQPATNPTAPGSLPQCAKCPMKKRLEKLEKAFNA